MALLTFIDAPSAHSQLVFGNDCGGLGGCSSSSGCAAEAVGMGLLTQSQEEKSEANVKVKKDGPEA